MSNAELSKLKKEDAFLYYSISSVGDAIFHCKQVESVSLLSPYGANDRSSTTVVRQRRLSTEYHPDVLFKD
jgi:hypothetical protein